MTEKRRSWCYLTTLHANDPLDRCYRSPYFLGLCSGRLEVVKEIRSRCCCHTIDPGPLSEGQLMASRAAEMNKLIKGINEALSVCCFDGDAQDDIEDDAVADGVVNTVQTNVSRRPSVATRPGFHTAENSLRLNRDDDTDAPPTPHLPSEAGDAISFDGGRSGGSARKPRIAAKRVAAVGNGSFRGDAISINGMGTSMGFKMPFIQAHHITLQPPTPDSNAASTTKCSSIHRIILFSEYMPLLTLEQALQRDRIVPSGLSSRATSDLHQHATAQNRNPVDSSRPVTTALPPQPPVSGSSGGSPASSGPTSLNLDPRRYAPLVIQDDIPAAESMHLVSVVSKKVIRTVLAQLNALHTKGIAMRHLRPSSVQLCCRSLRVGLDNIGALCTRTPLEDPLLWMWYAPEVSAVDFRTQSSDVTSSHAPPFNHSVSMASIVGTDDERRRSRPRLSEQEWMQADVFAFGLLVYWLGTHHVPFEALAEEKILRGVLATEIQAMRTRPEEFRRVGLNKMGDGFTHSGLRQLAEACLAMKPGDRPTTTQLLEDKQYIEMMRENADDSDENDSQTAQATLIPSALPPRAEQHSTGSSNSGGRMRAASPTYFSDHSRSLPSMQNMAAAAAGIGNVPVHRVSLPAPPSLYGPQVSLSDFGAFGATHRSTAAPHVTVNNQIDRSELIKRLFEVLFGQGQSRSLRFRNPLIEKNTKLPTPTSSATLPINPLCGNRNTIATDTPQNRFVSVSNALPVPQWPPQQQHVVSAQQMLASQTPYRALTHNTEGSTDNNNNSNSRQRPVHGPLTHFTAEMTQVQQNVSSQFLSDLRTRLITASDKQLVAEIYDIATKKGLDENQAMFNALPEEYRRRSGVVQWVSSSFISR